MSTIQTKFIVVSLPRTGTLSISQMFTTLGFRVEHPVGPSWESFLCREDKQVLADTPMYCKSVIEYVLANSDTVKFIYINKNPADWVASMIKVGLERSHNLNHDDPKKDIWSRHNQLDFDSLNEVLGGRFIEADAQRSFAEHKLMVEQTIPSDRLLEYHFSQGWSPLCEFIGMDVPDSEIPHLNVDTMFDKLTTP